MLHAEDSIGQAGLSAPWETGVTLLLHLSRAIDALNERVGRLVCWLILAAVVVSAGRRP